MRKDALTLKCTRVCTFERAYLINNYASTPANDKLEVYNLNDLGNRGGGAFAWFTVGPASN